jgi:hypothetical protein
MAYTPTGPYPKGRGDAIRSADWNEAVNEVIRLETDKFNRAGGTVSGNLTVSGGTISGTLANNIVGPNQLAANAVTTGKIADLGVTNGKLADNSVTNTKLADGSVTGQKLAAGSVPLDRIAGNIYFMAASISMSGSVGARSGIWVIGEYQDSTPPPVPPIPMVFVTSPTNGCTFNYVLEYNRFLSGGTRPFAGWIAWFTNQVAVVTEIQISSYVIRRPW